MKLKINGRFYEANFGDGDLLIDFLRLDLKLTGTKRGCDDGSCGACTVIINGEAKKSCHAQMKNLNGAEITTIEGLSDGKKLHRIQQAFLDKGAVQCGFCTPGMVMAAKALLDKNPNPSREEIKRALAGNICRCTGYKQIIEAVESLVKAG